MASSSSSAIPPTNGSSTSHPTQLALESSLKSTLHSLSLILSFYSSIQQLNVVSHIPHAPRNLTNQLELEATKYDQICGQLEARILAAIAALERDDLKAKGQLPPAPIAQTLSIPATTTLPLSDSTVMADPTLPAMNAAPTAEKDIPMQAPPPTSLSSLGLSIPPIEASTTSNELEGSDANLLNLLSIVQPDSTASSAPSSFVDLPGADQTNSSGMIEPNPALGNIGIPQDDGIDLNAMLSLLNSGSSMPQPGMGIEAGTETNAAMNDIDLSIFSNPVNTTDSATMNLTGGIGGTSDATNTGLDTFDFTNLDAGSLDELLKSLGAGN